MLVEVVDLQPWKKHSFTFLHQLLGLYYITLRLHFTSIYLFIYFFIVFNILLNIFRYFVKTLLLRYMRSIIWYYIRNAQHYEISVETIETIEKRNIFLLLKENVSVQGNNILWS